MSGEFYIDVGTTLKINGEGDADYAWSVESLADGAGRVSARIDLGAAPRPYVYRWRCKCTWQATPTQGGALQLYISESDGTYEDGDIGTSDAAMGDVDMRRNMYKFGSVIAEEADTSDMISGGVVEIYERYVSIAAYNDGGSAVNATDSNFYFGLTPLFVDPQ